MDEFIISRLKHKFNKVLLVTAGLSTRLYVNNLPFRFRYAELARLSIIEAKIIFNEKGSKGFGYITLGNEPGRRPGPRTSCTAPSWRAGASR